MHGINSGFMITDLKRRRSKHKAMPVILRALRFMHVGTVLIGGCVRNELVIDKELYLNARSWVGLVNDPSGYRLFIGLIKHSPYVQVGRHKIETHSHTR